MDLKKKTVGVQRTLDAYLSKDPTLHNNVDCVNIRELLQNQITGKLSNALRCDRWFIEASKYCPKVREVQTIAKLHDLAAWGDHHLLQARSNGAHICSSDPNTHSVEVVNLGHNINLVSGLSSDRFLAALHYRNEILIVSDQSTNAVTVAGPFERSHHAFQTSCAGFRDLKCSNEKSIYASTGDGQIFHWDSSASTTPIQVFSMKRKSSNKPLSTVFNSFQLLLDEHLIMASSISSTIAFWDVRMSQNSKVLVLHTENLNSQITHILSPSAAENFEDITILGTELDPLDPKRMAFTCRVQPDGIMAGVLELRNLKIAELRLLNSTDSKGLYPKIKSAWCPHTNNFLTGDFSTDLCLVNFDCQSKTTSNAIKHGVVKLPIDGFVHRCVVFPKLGVVYCGTHEEKVYYVEL